MKRSAILLVLLAAAVARAAPVEDALKKLGVSFESHERAPGQRNVVARVKGDGSARPLLVVADAQSDLAIELLSLLGQRKPRLARDVIIAWTGGGEVGAGMALALAEHRAAVDAEFALVLSGGAPGITVADRLYQDYLVRATGSPDDNPIIRLAGALVRFAKHRFPGRGPLRTTCVATQVHGGSTEDAFPVDAFASLSCRIVPHDSPADIARQIAAALADARLEVRAVPPLAGPAISSPAGGPVVIAARLAFGVPITPGVSAAATDARLLRAAGIAAYGISLGNTPEILYRIVVDVAENH